MSKNESLNLGYLGYSFQVKLVKQLVEDHKFSESIISIIDPNYFDNEYMRLVVASIKDYYEKYETIPSYETIFNIVKSEVRREIARESATELIKEVRESENRDCLHTQDVAIKFCKQQELKKATQKIQKILDVGDFDRYDECEELVKQAISVGTEKDEGVDIFHAIEDVLADDFRDPIPTGLVGIDNLMGGGLSKGELGVILAAFGVGKSQPLHSKVLTPNGWTTMGEIKEGDLVISRDGKPTKVVGVYPQGIRPTYKVKFNDGTETLCDEEHLWSVNTINQRNRRTRKDGKIINLGTDNFYRTMKTIEMVDNVKVWGGRRLNYRIPRVEPVEFEEKNLLIDPYVLGVILGDGCITEHNHPHFVTKDEEIINEVKSFYDKVSIKEQNRDIEKEVDGELVLVKRSITKVSFLGIKDDLKVLGLYGCNSETKFIPEDYIYSSVEDRVKILQGLVDTDGSIDGCRIEITTVSKTMASQIREIVLSLGGTASINEKETFYDKDGVRVECKLAYRVNFSFPSNIGFNPCRLNRKLCKYNGRTKYSDNKFISSIEYYGEEDSQCIMVDNPEHLYVTDDYIVTHNTTLITRMANTAYLDGKNVVQIFFEDNVKVIQRKHLTCFTEIELSELGERKEEVKELLPRFQNLEGNLILKKMSSDGTTIPHIKQYLRKLISSGIKPDIVFVDYIDCIQPTKQFKDEYSGEGNVMRQFETMLSELDIAGWTAVQGNRSAIGADLVEANMMGGSIKKGQIGHFILSVAKTLDQKEEGRATLAILKSRFGRDGVVFDDIVFDNGTLTIDTSESTDVSLLQHEKGQKRKESDFISETIAKKRNSVNNN
jgi:hypothetical protein